MLQKINNYKIKATFLLMLSAFIIITAIVSRPARFTESFYASTVNGEVIYVELSLRRRLLLPFRRELIGSLIILGNEYTLQQTSSTKRNSLRSYRLTVSSRLRGDVHVFNSVFIHQRPIPTPERVPSQSAVMGFNVHTIGSERHFTFTWLHQGGAHFYGPAQSAEEAIEISLRLFPS